MDGSLEGIARAFCRARGMKFVCKAGEGTFKQTFRVVSPNGTTLALKIFKPGTSSERNKREFDAMLRCNHPNIAKLHSVGPFAYRGKPTLTALEEFLAGGVLSKNISLSQCLTYGDQLIDALRHLAQLRLVHRDLKPENVIFRPDGKTPVIVDFGLVRNLAEPSLTPTWQPQGPCTPFFASPEQLNNEKHMIDWRSDQFALGVVFSFVYFGVHPHSEPRDNSSWDAISRVAARRPPSLAFLSNAEQQLPVLLKMVSPWPVGRFRVPDDLASAWRTQTGRI